MSVYKPCDIRGPVADLSPDLYRRWGISLGRQVAPGSDFIVGGDVRTSTPVFRDALVEGLKVFGVNILDLGVVPTPMVYFARRLTRAAGCAIVTASHNPPDVNGLKWMIGPRPPEEADVRRLEAESTAPASQEGRTGRGAHRALDVREPYAQWIEAQFAASPKPAHVSVTVDPGNGCWANLAGGFLTALFPEVRFATIHDRRDGMFPDRGADCSRPNHLGALAHEVVARQDALGIAFDGDGDRVAFVDDRGTCLSPEETTHILLHSFNDALRGAGFVHDVKFSDRVGETARRLGATVWPERSGHAFIRQRILDTNALFGAEVSGHYFYGALDSCDDGLYTACRLLCHLAARRRPLSALREACPPVYMTPDLRLSLPAEARARALDGIRSAFAGQPQQSIDGVRIDFPTGWALVRASVTESALTFRFEADSEAGLDHLVGLFCPRSGDLGNQIESQYDQWRRSAQD
ncbi:MAG TPA: hypothetical protein PLO37_14110 [Candidatus Hydrogenedentes bacterium]|nr:hypothetical protein [Candidatus Hydrogenedentota bacterium]HPG67979.1 hypothetical protein [Candidatus Hydrogenedentota bacterium]